MCKLMLYIVTSMRLLGNLYHLHLRLNSKPLTENSAERLTARILLQNRLSSDTRHLVSESLSEAPTTNRCMQ